MSAEPFPAGWLRLREPVDARSRDRGLVRRLRAWWPAAGGRVVDLGAGTGSNARWLAPRLGPADWRLVDNDPRLLAIARRRGHDGRLADLTDALRGQLFYRADLVTASALIDLVSAAWVDGLIERCRTSGAAVYIALTYDGTIRWDPSDPADDRVRDLVNRHQRTDKGFGPALGPAAAMAAAERLRAAGYRVWTAPSPWRLGPGATVLQHALTHGWAGAARALAPEQAAEIDAWADRRMALITDRHSRLTVGHVDLLALPRSKRRR